MALKALLCSNALSQHWSVLRVMLTLNSPKNYIPLLGGLPTIHSMNWIGAQGLMWGTRGPFLLAVEMVCYGCVGRGWLLEADISSTNCRNSKNCLQKYIYHSKVYSAKHSPYGRKTHGRLRQSIQMEQSQFKVETKKKD
jgi:hypothetical protein